MAHLIQGANFSPLLPAGNTTPSQEQVIFTKPTFIFLPCDLAHGERKTPRENGAESKVGLPSRSHSRADAQLSAQFPSLKLGTKALPGGTFAELSPPCSQNLGAKGSCSPFARWSRRKRLGWMLQSRKAPAPLLSHNPHRRKVFRLPPPPLRGR